LPLALLVLAVAVVGAVWLFYIIAQGAGTFTDKRDGQTYKKVTIGWQTWMAENLNYEMDSSWCYNDSASNCDKYGRLYNWEAAKTACPVGWHLPTDGDWSLLCEKVGGEAASWPNRWHIAGNKLKAKSGWYDWDGNDSGNGTDDYGFSALPGGEGNLKGEFYYYKFSGLGSVGTWWTSTKSEWFNGAAGIWKIYYINDEADGGVDGWKSQRYSVRCVKNGLHPINHPPMER